MTRIYFRVVLVSIRIERKIAIVFTVVLRNAILFGPIFSRKENRRYRYCLVGVPYFVSEDSFLDARSCTHSSILEPFHINDYCFLSYSYLHLLKVITGKASVTVTQADYRSRTY